MNYQEDNTVCKIDAHKNGAIKDITNETSFEVTLSVSTVEVESKKDGETVNDYIVQTFDCTVDRDELEAALRSHNYSTNVWQGTCANNNYIGMFGVTRDFDGGLTIAEARRMYSDYNYVLITTASHIVNEDGDERFRMIFPFAFGTLRFKTPLECRKVYYKLNELYPEADANCSNPGRKYFPSTSEFDAPYEFEIHRGTRFFDIDISDVPDEAVQGSAERIPWNGRLKPRSQMERILKHCPFAKWMIESIGNKDIEIREPLKYGLISILCWYEGGTETLLETLGRDPRPNRLSPARIKAKIRNAFKNGGPMNYASLIQRGWEGHAPDWTSTPTAWGYFVDTDYAINHITSLKGEDRRIVVERFFKEDFHVLSNAQQDACLVDLEKRAEISSDDLLVLARESFQNMDIVDRDLKQLLRRLRSFGTWPEDLGAFIFRWLMENGGKCYRDKEHICYLVWKDQAYELGENQQYRSLIWDLARITHKGTESQKILAAINAEADLKAGVVKFFTWLHTDTKNHVIYLHQNRDDGQLVRIDTEGVSSVPNGNNEHEVILTPPTKMIPVDLVSLDHAGYEEALYDFDQLVLRNIASSRTNQLMAACWSMCYPLIDYLKSCPHLRFEGRTKRGKTRAMDLLGNFVYGDQQYATSATTASIFSNAAINPLFMYDNLETKNITQEISSILLTIVSGGQREKRDPSTAHGVIIERTHCMACTTGIENLDLPEQINRTFSIPVDHYKNGSSGWSDRMYEVINSKRPEIFSAHMMLISRILNRIAKGEIETRVDWIKTKFPKGHDKDRVNDFLALMALVAEELIPVIDPDTVVDDLLTTWITEQDEDGLETARESSAIVLFLEALHKRAKRLHITNTSQWLDGEWKYNVDCEKNDSRCYVMTGTGADFLLSFGEIAREKHIVSPFKNAQQLVRRLADAQEILKDRGITYTSTLNREKTKIYTVTFPREEKSYRVKESMGID